MAANSALWWSVWWPWMLVWTGTALAFVAAVGIAGVHWWRSRRYAPQPRHLDISFYLDGESVLDLYQRRRYEPALSQQVEEKLVRGSKASVTAELSSLKGSAEKGVTQEIFSTYIKEAKPITVIGIILDVLEKEHDIVYIDLRRQRLIRNKALAREQRRQDLDPVAPVRLVDLEGYVSVLGRFKAVSKTEQTTIFTAPYGDPGEAGGGARVRVECVDEGLRRNRGEGTFQARCLGKVQEWDPHSRELVIHPIAIFQ
ncbi:hypothetical protein [Amycolatopsis sp. NPDC059021]|uniref:hypothetical protein n=1 Tax=Amycolatopsis sp. NPDC059021 TaxID=3346704 RepID=UPI003670118A